MRACPLVCTRFYTSKDKELCVHNRSHGKKHGEQAGKGQTGKGVISVYVHDQIGKISDLNIVKADRSVVIHCKAKFGVVYVFE